MQLPVGVDGVHGGRGPAGAAILALDELLTCQHRARLHLHRRKWEADEAARTWANPWRGRAGNGACRNCAASVA